KRPVLVAGAGGPGRRLVAALSPPLSGGNQPKNHHKGRSGAHLAGPVPEAVRPGAELANPGPGEVDEAAMNPLISCVSRRLTRCRPPARRGQVSCYALRNPLTGTYQFRPARVVG